MVVGGHGTQADIVLFAVEQHDRDAVIDAAFRKIRRHRHRGENDAVNLVVENLGHHVLHVADRRRGHEDQHVVALFLQRHREFLDRLRIELVLQVGDDQPDDATLAGDHRPRERVGAVAQLFRRFQDLFARRPGRARARGENTADRGLADACLPRHFEGCHAISHQSAVQPPSTISEVPVTSAAASDAR